MADSKRSVLITGCSDGGMGAALAIEFHKAGLHVYATARDSSKMKTLAALGIETLLLDIQSESSIQDCVRKVSRLDILINNAGATYTMPIADISISEAKKLFDLNVWGYIAVTQAFLPLLLSSPKAIIANHTSIGAGSAIPFQATYNASKAAMAMFSDTLRLELQPFRVSVVELRTGGVKTNIAKSMQAKNPQLPEDSIYSPAKEVVERALRIEYFQDMGITPEQWAKGVVADLLKAIPPSFIWRGESAWLGWFGSLLPHGWLDRTIKKMTGLDKIESIIAREQ
ncbi:IBR finger domain protein [Polychaeton citri CBS 116435]|uniref:IBR finger domain protein n=1 Tax=Polychaeton citri CBS 116435 TaxID=1314669 RepID=A0A9P4QBH4_9PEZI|nr:IBR finger domain protein [Polychaeton citri CBS 116435]